MDVKINIYETPKPAGREGETLEHARVESKGTRKLEEICKELVPKGLNTAQIKGILDGLAVYMGKSLRDGYHIELEDIGIFSLSVRSRVSKKDPTKMTVEVDGVNFKCSSKFKERARKAKLKVNKEAKPKLLSLARRKEKLLTFLAKNSSINVREYTRLNNCTEYRARIDLKTFEEEGIVVQNGNKTHKIYLLKTTE